MDEHEGTARKVITIFRDLGYTSGQAATLSFLLAEFGRRGWPIGEGELLAGIILAEDRGWIVNGNWTYRITNEGMKHAQGIA